MTIDIYDIDDVQISMKLAKAIGWERIKVDQSKCYVIQDTSGWIEFNYRDDRVILPIARRYGCLPKALIQGYDEMLFPKITSWELSIWTPINKKWVTVSNPDMYKTIAFGVIARNMHNSSVKKHY